MNKKQVEKGLVDTVWGVFSSVRLSVIVLTLLAVTSIIGTVIPQNGSPAMYVERFGEATYGALQFLDIFDMYHSWWFQLLMVLLGINLVVCSLDRLPSVLKIVGKKQRMVPDSYRRATKGEALKMAGAPAEVADALSLRLKSAMGTFTIVEEGEHRLLFAEKGRWTRLGVYVVHASVLLLLGGGLLGSLFGYEGYMNIPEGETSREVSLRGTEATIPLDFEIRCDDFDVSFYDTGAPNEYRSDLVVLEEGVEVLTKRIVVNDPLRYKGISFYQSSYGTVAPKSASFSFTSKASGMSYPAEGPFGEPLVIPEGWALLPPCTLSTITSFVGMPWGTRCSGCWRGRAKSPCSWRCRSNSPGSIGCAAGDVTITVGEFENSFYTGLQVTKDPGVWFVYAGFLLLITGCYITFFMNHQGYMVEVAHRKKGSVVTLYGNANKNKLGMEMAIRRLTEKLEKETRTLEGQVKR